ncbi:MAG: hypothetical protein KGL39_05290 [Patescibacteria group bacterium]|nr:hypothetical protein [Patescibacteria group bacterium]
MKKLIISFAFCFVAGVANAQIAPPSIPYVVGTWTPTDASGAGLTFTGVSAAYTLIGNRVFATATITYPSTANALQSIIGGFPYSFPASTYGRSCVVTYSSSTSAAYLLGNNGAATADFFVSGGAGATNVNLSGAVIYFQCNYPTT